MQKTAKMVYNDLYVEQGRGNDKMIDGTYRVIGGSLKFLQ